MGVGDARRLPLLAVCYAACLAVGVVVLHVAPHRVGQALVAASSTDVHHMMRDPWLVLPASAFWVTRGALYWLPFTTVTIGWFEAVVGARVALLVVGSVHVVASVLSEAVVAVRVSLNSLPQTALGDLDVGPSYVVLAAVGAACVLLPRRRLIIVLGLAIPTVVFTVLGLPDGDVDALGHVLSVALGAGAGLLIRRRALRRAAHAG